jgi:hypothetical protein
VNFQVVWIPDALQDLAAIWMAASNRNAVTRAAQAIDLALAASPHTIGKLVFDTVYEYNHPPLGVEFEVIDDDMRVFVLAVWDTNLGRPAPAGN